MNKTKKLALTGAGVGFCLALFMSELAYYANSHHLGYDLSLLYLCLAPTSIMLMATERATPSAVAMVVLIFALSNALIYGFVFVVIGALCKLLTLIFPNRSRKNIIHKDIDNQDPNRQPRY